MSTKTPQPDHQDAVSADATEDAPSEDDQGVIVTAQPPRSEDDAESDSDEE